MTEEYQLLIDGKWLRGKDMLEVKNKYSGRTIASIPSASRDDLDAASRGSPTRHNDDGGDAGVQAIRDSEQSG